MTGTDVSVERVIKAPAASIFAVVADVSRHPEIDGSGTVVKPKDGGPQHLTMGSTFGMSMKMGIPYSMSNTVIEFEQDRRIAWQTVLAGPLGRFIGGRIWRYQDGATGRLGPTLAAADGKLNALQQAFRNNHALQCGFCTPGILMSFTDFLARNPHPSEAEIREVLSGHLCRCTGYAGIVAAIKEAASAPAIAGEGDRP